MSDAELRGARRLKGGRTVGEILPGCEIRRARELLGLTASQFAAVLAVHPTTVSRWEHDHRAPEGAAMILLASLLDRADPARSPDPQGWRGVGLHLLTLQRREGSLCALAELAIFACGGRLGWPKRSA